MFVISSLFVSLATQDANPTPKSYFLKDAKVVVRPGTVLPKANILIRNGKIASVGENVAPIDGCEVIDCAGLTAYAGLIDPFLRVSVDGVLPAQTQGGGGGGAGGGGGRPTQSAAEQAAQMARRDKDPFGLENNLLCKLKTGELKQKDVAAFKDLSLSGYGIAQVSASGGLAGPVSSVFKLSGNTIDPSTVLVSPGFVPFTMSGRGFSSYPGSAMGAIAVIRQALCDAGRYGRMTKLGQKPDENKAIENLVPVASAETSAVFDDLNEVTFFQAKKIADEFGLNVAYGFRQDAGSVADLMTKGNTVMLKGNMPMKPSIGNDLSTASLTGTRAYFNEMQAGAELDKKGVEFVYAPSSTGSPLEGIRAYVRGGLDRNVALAAMTTRPAQMLKIDGVAGTVEPGKLGNVLLMQGDLFDSTSQIMAVIVDGQKLDFKMPERKPAESLKADEPAKLVPIRHEIFPAPAEKQAAFRLYRNATIWTEGPQGVIKGGDLLIKDGKIVAVGKGLSAPSGCEVIDATGKHISPGIWDCHSHTGINGGVNEGSNMITIECRIGDVVNHQAINIYQQLSGGTVGAQQLHGSANVIGGQTNPVKWRWGSRPTAFHIAGAPEGVKFALGQNPIREDASGFGAQQQPIGTTLLTWRPRTRMGNEESIRRALQLGKEYNTSWADYQSGKTKIEPRRDLQLEGLGEVVSQKRLVHSHGYRSDELLMLLRVVKEYGGKIATLQHVLEGYKIADEMAMDGVGGSTFADWWGYKLEAYDAIPYNAALMADRGVSVSINSDSDNQARRLNQEAAKAMRYGGVSAEKALSFVTIEPAKQMGIADHTGSLEVGKDADLAVWTSDPLSVFSVCTETYVDGVKLFDRAFDAEQRKLRDAELLEAKKALSSESSPFSVDATPKAPEAGAKGRTSVSFGIGPIHSEPGTSRYDRKAVLITGAMVHPMDGKPFVGDVLINSNGKIEAIGQGLKSDFADHVNGRGRHLYPGLIDPATGIGLNEIGQVPASDDSSERGNFHPDYRVERVINPEWETMGVARQQGILTALVKPSGAGISGQAALISTEGYTWEDLTIQGGVAMVCSTSAGGFDFGDVNYFWMRLVQEYLNKECDDDGDFLAGQARGAQASMGDSELTGISKQLQQARDYMASLESATPEKPVARDQKLEELAKVTRGEIPVLLSVNSPTEIMGAVNWAEKERVKLVLYGCARAGEIADWLADKQVPIILSALYRLPANEQTVDMFYSLPGKLAKAGVKFCLTTDNDKDVRQLRDQAGWAAAYGLDREEAARSITLRAAEVLGIQDRLGAIKPGLDGTMILTDGEIIETKSRVLRAWIQGREVELTNRQTKLYDKYRSRPKITRKPKA